MMVMVMIVKELYPEADLAIRIGETLMLILITGDSDENNLDHDEGEIVLTIGYKYPLG